MFRYRVLEHIIPVTWKLKAVHVFWICEFNPFTAPACKISGLKDARTRLQTVYFPLLQHLLSVRRVSLKILSHDSVKNKTETVQGFKFCTLIVHFQAASWQWRISSWKPVLKTYICGEGFMTRKSLTFYSRHVGNSATAVQKPETRVFRKIAIHSGCCPVSQPPGTGKALSPQVAALW